MGLDTYAYDAVAKKPMKDELFGHVPQVLCGGLFSGNGGSSSFRGKVYAGYVQAVTGVSLYQEEIPNQIVKQMAELLAKPNGYIAFNHGVDTDEANALTLWFKVVADNNGIVVGWW
jgi:hypothetical protein